MPAPQSIDLDAIAETGVAACERFVAESAEINWYWKNGRLNEWIDKQIPQTEESVEVVP